LLLVFAVRAKSKFKNAGETPAVHNPTHSSASSFRTPTALANLRHRHDCLCY
jgi:hypothetical protein